MASSYTGGELARAVRAVVDQGLALVLSVPEARTAERPAGGGWCVREILGHLIDSACNNHRRFIINQDVETLIIDPYDQNAWVARNRYAERQAGELAALWAVYNRHLAHVLEGMPPAVLNQPRGPIAGLGFSYISTTDSTASIGHLADDYIGHLKHHLAQLERLG